jgi:hypothetical protein
MIEPDLADDGYWSFGGRSYINESDQGNVAAANLSERTESPPRQIRLAVAPSVTKTMPPIAQAARSEHRIDHLGARYWHAAQELQAQLR